MRQYFGDFDARKRSTTKDTRTAGMNKGIGCLSRTQFERSMFNLFGLHEPLNEEDLAILFRKYEKSGEFNYFRFVRDLEEEQVCEIPVWPNAVSHSHLTQLLALLPGLSRRYFVHILFLQ